MVVVQTVSVTCGWIFFVAGVFFSGWSFFLWLEFFLCQNLKYIVTKHKPLSFDRWVEICDRPVQQDIAYHCWHCSVEDNILRQEFCHCTSGSLLKLMLTGKKRSSESPGKRTKPDKDFTPWSIVFFAPRDPVNDTNSQDFQNNKIECTLDFKRDWFGVLEDHNNAILVFCREYGLLRSQPIAAWQLNGVEQ